MPGGHSQFPTTIPRVLSESRSSDSKISAQAWDALIRSYWKSVYKYLRIRHLKNSEDAKDLTQGLFQAAFENSYFERFDPKKAKFRTFLRCCIDRFVWNDNKRTARLKRGGGFEHLSMDLLDAEQELAFEKPAQDPELLFEAEWLRSIFDQALKILADDYEHKGKQKSYKIFESYYLFDGVDCSYEELACRFNLSKSDVTNRLAGVRRDFRRALLSHLKEVSVSEDEYRRDARKLLGIERSHAD